MNLNMMTCAWVLGLKSKEGSWSKVTVAPHNAPENNGVILFNLHSIKNCVNLYIFLKDEPIFSAIGQVKEDMGVSWSYLPAQVQCLPAKCPGLYSTYRIWEE